MYSESIFDVTINEALKSPSLSAHMADTAQGVYTRVADTLSGLVPPQDFSAYLATHAALFEQAVLVPSLPVGVAPET